jgi:hypothetical protein
MKLIGAPVVLVSPQLIDTQCSKQYYPGQKSLEEAPYFPKIID